MKDELKKAMMAKTQKTHTKMMIIPLRNRCERDERNKMLNKYDVFGAKCTRPHPIFSKKYVGYV